LSQSKTGMWPDTACTQTVETHSTEQQNYFIWIELAHERRLQVLTAASMKTTFFFLECCVVYSRKEVTNVSEVHAASIIRLYTSP
jgi:hypothetical protein